MKLYQAVKRYGVDRVRMVVKNETPLKTRPSVIEKIKEAYKKAPPMEKGMLLYSPVDIAYWFLYVLPVMKAGKDFEYLPQQELLLYILESLEPDNFYVKISKQWRKEYYRKK